MRTKSGGELLAQRNLERQGFSAYHPRLLQRHREKGGWRKSIQPLFPRYIFLSLLLGKQSMSAVKSTKGVMGIVRFGETFAVVPDPVIVGLRERENKQTGLHHLTDVRLKPNSRVRITDGPFFGLEGVFVREDSHARVIVLLNLLGQPRTLSVDESLVEESISH